MRTPSTPSTASGADGGSGRAATGRAPGPDGAVVRTEGLVKRFGDQRAVDGLNLVVRPGTVHGLLGPNGAGKTTAVRVLTTLSRPDGGRAWVGGHDVARQPHRVRRRIGLTGQNAAVDELLSARQNLRMFGRLFHLEGATARRRAEELLERFGLAGAAEQRVRTFSGGMRRRLDLACSMILAPEVLFLDEPTTGLDPRGRSEVWEVVRSLARAGTTVLLTTHYLDEADRLADRITVIDRGRAIRDDTPAGLKRTVGGDRVEVVPQDPAEVPEVVRILARVADGEPVTEEGDRAEILVHAPVSDRVVALAEVARELRDAGISVTDLGLRRPTLDEVFLQLTGRPTSSPDPGDPSDPSEPRAPSDARDPWTPSDPSAPSGRTDATTPSDPTARTVPPGPSAPTRGEPRRGTTEGAVDPLPRREAHPVGRSDAQPEAHPDAPPDGDPPRPPRRHRDHPTRTPEAHP